MGGSLGPLLFLIYINDLEDGILSNVFKFADDTKLFRQVKDTADTVGTQEDLDRLVKWHVFLTHTVVLHYNAGLSS